MQKSGISWKLRNPLGRGRKAMHLAYIGDATIGKKVNIGAGVITVNYDGKDKFPTTIEDDAFIGSDSRSLPRFTSGKAALLPRARTIPKMFPRNPSRSAEAVR